MEMNNNTKYKKPIENKIRTPFEEQDKLKKCSQPLSSLSKYGLVRQGDIIDATNTNPTLSLEFYHTAAQDLKLYCEICGQVHGEVKCYGLVRRGDIIDATNANPTLSLEFYHTAAQDLKLYCEICGQVHGEVKIQKLELMTHSQQPLSSRKHKNKTKQKFEIAVETFLEKIMKVNQNIKSKKPIENKKKEQSVQLINTNKPNKKSTKPIKRKKTLYEDKIKTTNKKAKQDLALLNYTYDTTEDDSPDSDVLSSPNFVTNLLQKKQARDARFYDYMNEKYSAVDSSNKQTCSIC